MGKALILISCAFCLFSLYALLTTINDFSKSYENCKDDFEVINKCNCLPDTGNYSYFVDKYDLIEGEIYSAPIFNLSGSFNNEN
jgi:hypothetical protein